MKALNSQEIMAANRSAWSKMPTRQMHPDINLVVCQRRLFPKPQKRKLLYVGFGEGQNLEYLTQAGFNCYGTEIARNRLEVAKQRLAKRGLAADLRLVKSDILPFPDNFFDIVVAWQSLYYNTRETFREALREIERVLKPDGHFLSSMVSPRQKLLCYKKISPSTYHPAPQTKQQNCTLICLKDRRQIRSFYKRFKNIKIGYYSSELFRSPNFHWVIYCEKKNNGREK